MRLIDADKVDFSDVFVGASDFAMETREAAKSLIDMQPSIDFGGYMKKQKVVRTYPNNYTNPMTALRDALGEGWIVVMCNQTYLENNSICLEYILEKDISEN